MSEKLLIEDCAIATVDAGGTEHESGYITIDGNRIAAVGSGSAPEEHAGEARRVEGSGLLATPGLVNCHHHLYQWATRGWAQNATLFEWLVELYPVWAYIDEEIERGPEMREALIFARLAGGPKALTARQALELATIHGARCLGREGEIGSLEPGKLADVAL